MRNFARLQSNEGTFCDIGFDFNSPYKDLVRRGDIDFLIFATEDGFSPLGQARSIVSEELNISENEITKLADWNRVENNNVSIVGIKSLNSHSQLKGCVLAACENSKCYKQFLRNIRYSNERIPDRDFFYNVTYESIAYAASICNAKKIAITHLSASGNYHTDIAICTAEAIAHFHDENPFKVKSFSFVGCCINDYHLRGIQMLNQERNTKHKKINIKISSQGEHIQVIDLQISRREKDESNT